MKSARAERPSAKLRNELAVGVLFPRVETMRLGWSRRFEASRDVLDWGGGR